MAQTVRVKFLENNGRRVNSYTNISNNAEYDYAYDGSCDVGDIAMVHNGNDYCLVKVVDVIAGTTTKTTKPLLFVASKEVMDVYQQKIKDIKRRKEILGRLEKMAQEETIEERFLKLASRSPEASSLLEELKTLGL